MGRRGSLHIVERVVVALGVFLVNQLMALNLVMVLRLLLLLLLLLVVGVEMLMVSLLLLVMVVRHICMYVCIG